MSLIHSFLLLKLALLFPFCHCREEFRCKAVAGCEINARCDPSPPSWAHLDRNEFPINCVSDDASKKKRNEDEVQALKTEVKDLKKELKRLQNEDIKEMKEQIRELQLSQNGAFDTTHHLTTTSPTTPAPPGANEWTVFQRRQDGSVDFYRTWGEYVNGFGSYNGEFWMGLEKLHRLTSIGNYELRIDLRDWEGNEVFAQYSEFSVGSASTYYRLQLSGYSGTAGDSLMKADYSYLIHNGMAFTTKNQDNDRSGSNCAERYKGGWWYNGCYAANLNGVYYKGGKYFATKNNGIVWYEWKKDLFYSLKFVEMKFRPAQ